MYTYKTETGHRQMLFKDHNFTLSCRQKMAIHLHETYKIMDIDLPGNTLPMKVDRILQWMSHHPTKPTYMPVLS